MLPVFEEMLMGKITEIRFASFLDFSDFTQRILAMEAGSAIVRPVSRVPSRQICNDL